MSKTAIFLQVRLNSSRMPGKALSDLCGKKLIQRTIEQMNKVNCDTRIILTTKEAKKHLDKLVKSYGWKIFYGDKNNVLKRFVDAAIFFKIDTIVRATGDNPLLSYEIANETIEAFNENNVDICHLSNVPYGGGVEVVKTQALKTALKNSDIPYHLEHVTPYVYENKDKFKILIKDSKETDCQRGDVKISVDTRNDFERINYLIRNVLNNDYSIKNVIKTYDKLNFSKFKRILNISDNEEVKKVLNLFDGLKEDFEIFFSSPKIEVKETSLNLKIIEYDKLKEATLKEGVFDRVILYLSHIPKKDIEFYKSLGFTLSIEEKDLGINSFDMNILTANKKKSKTPYNFIDFDFSNESDKNKLINIVYNLSSGLNYCPYCSNKNETPKARNELWNMFFCKKCGLYYLNPFKEYDDIYVDKYFTDEYKAQYGKTYEEDKPNILKFAQKRFDMIKKYKPSGFMLDFGSGLGFFSELAKNNGFKTLSIDISDYAVNYIKEKLKLEAIKGDLTFFEKSERKFDLISSFYVIEHIKDFEKAIFLFEKHLNERGVIALSTPNASGVSVKLNFKTYKNVHPKDHYRIFSYSFFKKILKKNGFINIKIVTNGVYPIRLVKNEKILKFKIIYKIIYTVMKLFKMGDTFEIYAQKK